MSIFITAETAGEIGKHFRYEPETGFFYRLRDLGKKKAGDRVMGTADAAGYLRLYFGGYEVKAHRAAWYLMTGEWPEGLLDHKNGVPPDNRWENLRKATSSQNHANRRVGKSNRSGYKGVYWDNARTKWVAKIRHQGKDHHLGGFDCPEKASEAYCAAAVRIHGEFACGGNAAAVRGRWTKSDIWLGDGI